MISMVDNCFNKTQTTPSCLWHSALLSVIFLVGFYPSAGHAQQTAGFHVIVDTQTLPALQGDASTQIDALRMIGGVLSESQPIQMWRYQGKLLPLKPNYIIDKHRASLPSATLPQQDTSATTLIEAIDLLVGQIKAGNGTQDILLITGDAPRGIDLMSPEVEKIINTLLATNIRFSTLTMSNEPTQPLYELLAHASHGRVKYLKVEDSLATHFFDFLDRYSALDYIPLEDTLLKIDSSIHEATVLLFKQTAEDKEIEIIPPLGKPFTNRNAPESVTWIRTPYFDAIHIANPAIGTWQVYGEEEQPHSRIVVRTDLQLTGDFFDDLVASASAQSLDFSLKRKGTTITDPEVMNLVAVKAVQLQNNLAQHTWFPADNGKNGDSTPKDGIFTLPLRDTLGSGDYLLKITASSAKFQREMHRYISTTDQTAWLHRARNAENGGQRILIVPYTRLIKPESIIVNASIKNEHGENSYVEIPRVNQYAWALTVNEGKSLVVNLAGTGFAGNTTSLWLPEIALTEEKAGNEAETSSLTQLITNVLDINKDDTNDHNELAQEPLPIEASEPQRVTVFSIGLHLTVANFIAFVLGFGVYNQWLKREYRWQQNLRGRLP